MFDQVPIPVWLLLAIAIAAYAPALYVFRYVAHDPSRRDIAELPEDLDWRTPAQLTRSLAILVVLAALAVFIFTPAAAQFARSPAFLPILMAACGAWAIYTVPKGISTGKIEPFIKGVSHRYERATQPKRFWASVGWNAVFGGLCLWLGYVTIDQGIEDQCYDRGVSHTPQEELSACIRLIQKCGKASKDYANLVAARGFAYHRMGDLNDALADYNEVLSLDAKDSYALYNRALIFDRRGDARQALADYSASLDLRPDNFDGFLNRGDLFLRNGKLAEAREDFARAHELRPQSAAALAYRGMTYALQEDLARAAQDFGAARALDPADPVLRRGQALLGANAGGL